MPSTNVPITPRQELGVGGGVGVGWGVALNKIFNNWFGVDTKYPDRCQARLPSLRSPRGG